MEIASCGLYLQPMTNGALEEKFVREFFCPYFIVSLHAITEHGEVVSKGVLAVNLLPDGLTGWAVKLQSWQKSNFHQIE